MIQFKSVISKHFTDFYVKHFTWNYPQVISAGPHHCGSAQHVQHWFRFWLGTIKQHGITWNNVDWDLCRHMAFLGHSELSYKRHGESTSERRSCFYWYSIENMFCFEIWTLGNCLWLCSGKIFMLNIFHHVYHIKWGYFSISNDGYYIFLSNQ